MIKSIGLTGNMGSGKTLISNVFYNLGVPVFNADIEAKKLYEDKVFLEKIKKEFGDIILKDNKLVRENLAKIVFNDKKRLEKLNSMIHPIVLENYKSWVKFQDFPYVIHESAIIFESGWKSNFYKIICIDSPEDISIERVRLRDNIDEDRIKQRLKNQMPIEEKKSMSDFIIFHDNKTMILPQILIIHNELIK